MSRYEFAGGDPIDHFVLGRVSPGDVHDLDADPGPPWKTVKRRPSRAQSDEASPARTEPASDIPDTAQEV